MSQQMSLIHDRPSDGVSYSQLIIPSWLVHMTIVAVRLTVVRDELVGPEA